MGATAAVAAGLGWTLLHKPAPMEAPAQTPEVKVLTSYPGLESSPALSSDGKQVAFVWNGEKQDNTDIYVKLMDAGNPLRLTQDPRPDTAPANRTNVIPQSQVSLRFGMADFLRTVNNESIKRPVL